MKKTILWILKASMAGLISFAIISGICFFYYNLPVHYTNTTGATDYFWDKDNNFLTNEQRITLIS